jgi:hypothetical protein
VAMLESPAWYLCCMDDLVNSGGTFQLAAMPSYNGKVGGRMDQDTYRIVKGSSHAGAAFQALAYLVTTGADKLLLGNGNPPGFGNIPALKSLQPGYRLIQEARFPFVTADSWDVLYAGLNYPDSPSAEAWLPNLENAWNRLSFFADLLRSTGGLALPNEQAKLEYDLGMLFNNGVSYIPALAAPADGAVLPFNRPVFDWVDVPGALRYEIQISRSTGFSPLVTGVVVVPSTYTPAANLPANRTLYWRVRARFAAGNGPWSPYSTLQTAAH